MKKTLVALTLLLSFIGSADHAQAAVPTCTIFASPPGTINTSKLDYDNNGTVNGDDTAFLGTVLQGINACPANKICDLNGNGSLTTSDIQKHQLYVNDASKTGPLTFQWNIIGSITSFSVDNGVGSLIAMAVGTKAVSQPATSKVYTATVTGPEGTSTCQVAVVVPVAPSCTLFAAPPGTLNTSKLDYDNSGTVVKADSDYLLNVAVGNNSCPSGKTCDVNGDGVVTSLDAETHLVYVNSSSKTGPLTFQWGITGTIGSFSINQGVGSLTPIAVGTKAVTQPAQTTTYTGTVTGGGGTATCSVTVTVPTGYVRVARVGENEMTAGAPAGTQARVDTGTPSSTNPNTFSNISAGSHTAYATNVVGHTESAGICTYPSAGAECTVTSFNLTPTCSGTDCSVPITVTSGNTTKVAFRYQSIANLRATVAPASFTHGSTVIPRNYSGSVTNSGTLPTNSAIPNTIFTRFQKANAIDVNGEAVGTVTTLPNDITHGDLDGGSGTGLLTRSYTFPPADAGTTRYIRFCADSADTVVESNEDDNCSAWAPIAIDALPDYMANKPAASPSILPRGQVSTFSGTINNVGNFAGTNIPSVFRVKNSGGTTIATISAGTMSSVSASTNNLAVTPVSYTTPTTAGTYTVDLCANMNTSGTVPAVTPEGNSGNNCGLTYSFVVTDVNINPNGSLITGIPASVTAGTNLAFSSAMFNSGTGPATNFSSAFVITAPGGGITRLSTGNVASVSAQNSYTMSQTYTPTALGTHSIMACGNMDVNGVIGTGLNETVTNDNCGEPRVFTVTADVDLEPDVVNTVVVTPSAPKVGTPATFAMQIRNTGLNSTVTTFTNRLRKANDINGSGSTNVATNTAGPLVGGSKTNTFNISYTPVAGDVGTKYFSICADEDLSAAGTIAETDELNNCGAWTPVAIAAAGQPDLVPHSVITSFAPNGSQTNFRYTVGNSGAVSAPAFTATVWVTRSSTGSGATILGTTNVPTGLSGVSSQYSLPYTFTYNPSSLSYTLADAAHFVRVCVDTGNVVTESNEGNNCTTWDGLEAANVWQASRKEVVFVEGMEVSAGNVSASASPVNAGDQVTLSAQIVNFGFPTAAPFINRFRISTSANGSSPTDIGTYTQTTIIPEWEDRLNWVPTEPKPTATASIQYTFNTPGTYYVSMCADSTNVLPELIEGNNCGGWTPITVQSVGDPDLTANATVASLPAVRPGQSFTLNGSVNNVGAATATGFPSVFRIKNQDGTVTYIRQTAGTKTLAAGVTNSPVTQATYSTTTIGIYRIDLCANMNISGTVPVIAEPNFGNNCGYEAIVNVALPDLTITGLTPTTATLNVPLKFTATVKNSGPAPTGVSFPVNFQRADDDQGTENLILSIGKGTATALNGGGVTQSVSMDSNYTFTAVGGYYVRACADKDETMANGPVTESDEADNCGDWMPILVTDSGGNSNGVCGSSRYTCIPSGSLASGSQDEDEYGYSWTCNGTGSGSATACYESKGGGGGPSCRNLPANADPYPDPDDKPSTNIDYAYSDTDTSAKCEFKCVSGYGWIDGSCQVNVCTNNAINPPYCNVCPEGRVYDAAIDQCVIDFGGAVPTVDINANPTLVKEGLTTNVTWEATNAVTCEAKRSPTAGTWSGDEFAEFTGNVDDTVNVQTVYTLTCSNANGNASDSVTVNVRPNFDTF